MRFLHNLDGKRRSGNAIGKAFRKLSSQCGFQGRVGKSRIWSALEADTNHAANAACCVAVPFHRGFDANPFHSQQRAARQPLDIPGAVDRNESVFERGHDGMRLLHAFNTGATGQQRFKRVCLECALARPGAIPAERARASFLRQVSARLEDDRIRKNRHGISFTNILTHNLNGFARLDHLVEHQALDNAMDPLSPLRAAVYTPRHRHISADENIHVRNVPQRGPGCLTARGFPCRNKGFRIREKLT